MITGLEKDFDLASIENSSQKEIETVKKMKSSSKAGAGLLKFVYAILSYNAVFREVKPKRDKATFNFRFLILIISILQQTNYLRLLDLKKNIMTQHANWIK